jgi:hypothetical protein
MSRKNGGIIGPANTPVGGLLTGLAGGVWRMNDVANFVGNSQWPLAPQSIDNSLRFDDGSSDYLHRTPSGAGNRKTFTISLWFKRSDITRRQALFNNTDGSGQNGVYYDLQADDTLLISDYGSGSFNWNLETTQVFRDVSAWYHLVISVDTTQSTASNRVKIYINGTQITNFDASNYPSQDSDTLWNRAERFEIGSYNGTGNYFSGYMAETVLIDGSQLDPTSFGEFDTTTGIWKPKKIGQIANAGTNSFYLDFKDSSNVGNDASGLNNDFTVNNLTSIDQSTDTCVVNYATYNSLDNYFQADTLSNANLTMTGGGQYAPRTGSMGLNNGKWYWEIQVNNWESSDGTSIGISSKIATATNYEFVNDSGATVGYGYFSNGVVYGNGSSQATGYSTASGTHIIGVALNLTDNKIAWSYDGTWQGSTDPGSGNTNMISITDPASLTSGTYFPAFSQKDNSRVLNVNFGSPSFSISSGNSDANGFGNFEYPVPSGYYALNTSNLNTYG